MSFCGEIRYIHIFYIALPFIVHEIANPSYPIFTLRTPFLLLFHLTPSRGNLEYCLFFNFNFELGIGQIICKRGISSTIAYSTSKNSRTFLRFLFWPTHELKVRNHSMLPHLTVPDN